jgi:hypothetical protein
VDDHQGPVPPAQQTPWDVRRRYARDVTVVGRRETRRRKYLSLGIGELAAAAVFAAVLPRLVGQADQRALWCALIPLLVVLVQAGSYWLLSRAWVDRAPMPATLAMVYRGFRSADALLLTAGLVGVLLWSPEGSRSMLVVWAIWLFGAVEYVNYFVVRLAYPVGGWSRSVRQWRAPRLIQDLRTSGRAHPGPAAGSPPA